MATLSIKGLFVITQHNNTQHKKYDAQQHCMESHYADCCCAECHILFNNNAEYHYTECHYSIYRK